MVLSLIRRRANKKNTSTVISSSSSSYDCDNSDMAEISIPAHFRCPISLDLMKDPVTLSTGITYDRDSIEKWIESGNRTCPVTNQVLPTSDQIPNHALRRMIQDWCVQNRSHGVERIPTPRIPVTPAEISSVCARITAAAERHDASKCTELVAKIKAWAKDSERNRKCIAKSRAGSALALSFEALCASPGALAAAEEILSVLTWVLGCADEEARARLGNDTSLRCLVSFLQGNDLSSRQNAVLVIKELLSSSESNDVAESLATIEGSVEGLVRMIREPICPRATKASLTAIFFMISKNVNNTTATTTRALFVELGLVSLLLEAVLENSERGVCERASRVLDVICEEEKAREMAKGNALTIPLVVKRILRVSDSATELFVSVLWKLLVAESDGDDVEGISAALEAGGFEKMLVMLQIGCGDRLKEKVTDLLKLFNLHRRLVCVDSSADFKHLKRSF